MHAALGVDRDGDAPTVDERMVVPALGHEVLDVVVTAEGPVVSVVHLHDGGGAARPGAGAVLGVHRPALLRGDGGGARAEVQRIAGVGLEHGEQAGIAGQPARCVAMDAHARGLEDVGGARVNAGVCFGPTVGVRVEHRGIEQGGHRDMHDHLCGEPGGLRCGGTARG